MIKTIFFLIVVLVFIFTGCISMPTTQVKTAEASPTLAFIGAPEGSILYLDGLKIGDVNIYDGKKQILRVEPGTHFIEIKDKNGKIIFNQKIFVQNELKTIKVQ
jgi:hypothetical protein